PRITDLPARLGVERILLEYDLHHIARLAKPQDGGVGPRGVVAHPPLLGPGLHGAPFAAPLHLDGGAPLSALAALQRLERAGALLGQLALESRHVDRLAALSGDELREVDREPVGVVQLER